MLSSLGFSVRNVHPKSLTLTQVSHSIGWARLDIHAVNKYPLSSWFVVRYSVGITMNESEAICGHVAGNIWALVALGSQVLGCTGLRSKG